MADRLNGYRILILETREEAQFSRLLAEQGADVLQCPMFTIHDAPNPAPIEAWIRRAIDQPCDDLVLKAGTPASDYADHLCEIVRASQVVSAPGWATLAVKRRSRLHERVRKTLWGYAPDEALTNDELAREKYRSIRPAPGYPACPDHSQKPELFRLLNAGQNAGISLTESFAMMPTSAVSGYYFAHPEAQYFGVARIGRDQLEDYAKRRGCSIEQAEKWLRQNIGY